MNKAYLIPLSKDKPFSIFYGQRSYPQTKLSINCITSFFKLINSPFLSMRLFESRYFQSRLIIFRELKKLKFNLSDINVSLSHNKSCFIALVSNKDVKMAVDYEHNNRRISSALNKRISAIKKPNSLSPIGYINILETIVKISNINFHSLIKDTQTREFFGLRDTYITNIGEETIYSKFYSYNDNQICISSDKLEIFR